MDYKKVRVYLSNTNAVTYPVIRKALMPVLKLIDYVNNPKGNDMVIDCQHLTSENLCLAKMEILKEINEKHKQINR